MLLSVRFWVSESQWQCHHMQGQQKHLLKLMPIPHVPHMTEIIPTNSKTNNCGGHLFTGGPDVRNSNDRNRNINHLKITSKWTALGCCCKQNNTNGMSRRNYHKHDPGPFSLHNRSTTASRYISDPARACKPAVFANPLMLSQHPSNQRPLVAVPQGLPPRLSVFFVGKRDLYTRGNGATGLQIWSQKKPGKRRSDGLPCLDKAVLAQLGDPKNAVQAPNHRKKTLAFVNNHRKEPPNSMVLGGIFAQHRHSMRTVPIITLFISGTPLKTTHLHKRA